MTTTAQLQNGTAANDNQTASTQTQTQTETVKEASVTMTTFNMDQLGEEAKGFYRSLDTMDQILNEVKGLYNKKNSALYDFLEAKVYDPTPIAARAVVCLYRADYVETLIHAGLKDTKSTDKRTLQLLTVVRQCYLDLHDRAMGVRVIKGPARKKNRAKIEAFLTMKVQKQDHKEVLAETVKEPIGKAFEFLGEVQSGVNAIDARVSNIHREQGEANTRIRKLEEENIALRSEVGNLREKVAENNIVLEPLRKVAEEAVKTEAKKATKTH